MFLITFHICQCGSVVTHKTSVKEMWVRFSVKICTGIALISVWSVCCVNIIKSHLIPAHWGSQSVAESLGPCVEPAVVTRRRSRRNVMRSRRSPSPGFPRSNVRCSQWRPAGSSPNWVPDWSLWRDVKLYPGSSAAENIGRLVEQDIIFT